MTVGKAIDLMLLPLMGSLCMYTYAEIFFSQCYPICQIDQPQWDLPFFKKYYSWFFVPSNLLAGLASYVVLKEQPEIIQPPLTAYAITLFLHWVHYPLHQTKIHWGLVDAGLATMTAIYTTMRFYNVKKYAGYMMAPFVLILIHQTLWDGWCYKKHKDWTRT